MPSFNLETTLLPLSLLILLGWIVGRTQDIDLKSVATILVYGISPVVAFGSTAQISFHGIFVLLPVITFILAAGNGLFIHALGRKILKKKDMGFLLPIATGSGNNGYFGLPLAMAVFAPDQVGIYFLIMLGTTLFETTIGYYYVARGHLSVKQALRRAAGMPVTYAIILGLIFSALHMELNPGVTKLWEIARGCYVSVGMMIIGIALGKYRKLSWDTDFIALVMSGKYMLWLLLASTFIVLDTTFLHLYDSPIHAMILILAITPVAANVAAFAAQHDFKPQLAATIVFLTTIVSFAALPFTLPAIFAFAR
jgi:predicted permease